MCNCRSLFALSFLLLVAGCAEVSAPPGGPEDKRGPVVLESIPADGSVGLSGVRFIEVKFSEDIQIPKGATVLISPRPQKLPKVSWGGRGVKLEFTEPLPTNRTFVVSLPGGMSDLRGNKPDSAITVAFSTGPTLDSCSISGRVFNDDKQAAAVSVALYAEQSFQSGEILDSVYPDYLTSTGKNGEFVFKHLPVTKFRLIAFQKSGRDDRFRPGRDRFAVPDRSTDLTQATVVSDIYLAMTSQDTLPIRISSAVINNDRVLQLRLSKPVTSDQIRSGDSIVLTAGAIRLTAPALYPADSESFSTISAYFGSLSGGVGKLTWALDKDRPPLAFDSLRFPSQPDTTAPHLVFLTPNDQPLLTADTAVHFLFSEPLDRRRFADSAIKVISVKDSVRMICELTSPNPFELVYRPSGLAPGQQYRIDLNDSLIVDFAGNSAGDSLRQYRFSVYNTDSLGWIEGIVHTPEGDSTNAVTLSFRKLSDSRRFQFASAPRSFKFALPAGKYLVSGFVDRNGNGRYDRGLIFPYTMSEPFLPFADTVSVRARFETAGVELQFK